MRLTGRTVPAKDAKAISIALSETFSDEDEYRRLSENARDDVARRFAKEKLLASVEKYQLS
jgi:glycosyltransferase involved in cell wall biosynthesis